VQVRYTVASNCNDNRSNNGVAANHAVLPNMGVHLRILANEFLVRHIG